MYDCECKGCSPRVHIKFRDQGEERIIPTCVDFYIEDEKAYFEDGNKVVIMILDMSEIEEIWEEVLCHA